MKSHQVQGQRKHASGHGVGGEVLGVTDGIRGALSACSGCFVFPSPYELFLIRSFQPSPSQIHEQ